MSKGSEGFIEQPVSLAVPVGVKNETDLMAALDYLMRSFYVLDDDVGTDGMGRVRAADWLQAKYGTPK